VLAARLLHRLGERTGELSSAGVNGMNYWTVDGDVSLRDVAREAGLLERSGRRINRDALRSVCAAIPEGRWTTYGDVAKATGVPGAAQSVAGILATDWSIPNPHRVLRSGGHISPGWRSGDGGGPEVCRARLEAEGSSSGTMAPPSLIAGGIPLRRPLRSRGKRSREKSRPLHSGNLSCAEAMQAF